MKNKVKQKTQSNNNSSNSKGFKPSMRGKQGRKDNKDKRINFDNARESKFFDDVESSIERGSKSRSANNIEDFNRNAGLLKSAGSVPFATILGDVNIGSPNYSNKTAVPGIMAYYHVPIYVLNDPDDVANKAFQQVYSYLVHANSRNYKYEYTDVAMYIMAGIEVFSALADLIRVYGTIMYYPEKNRYLADGLITAMGFVPNDVRTNRGQLWFAINNLIAQTKQIWIPNVFPILTRQIRLNSYVYTDAAGDRSQIYVPVRRYYYQLSETGVTTGTSLVPALFKSSSSGVASTMYRQYWIWSETSGSRPGYNLPTNTVAEFVSMIQNMIDALVASEDRGAIYGDILKAYGAEKIYAMNEIGADFICTPQYNAEVLSQIENITVWNVTEPTAIFQDQNSNVKRLKTNWSYNNSITSNSTAVSIPPAYQVLNMHIAEQPSPEAVMIATRYKTAGAIAYGKNAFQGINTEGMTAVIDDDGFMHYDISLNVEKIPGAVYAPRTMGSEIVQAIVVFYYAMVGDNLKLSLSNQTFLSTVGNQTSFDATDLDIMAFDWHPFKYIVSYANLTETNAELNWSNAFGDYDNYTIIDYTTLDKLNQVAFYSLWGVPHI